MILAQKKPHSLLAEMIKMARRRSVAGLAPDSDANPAANKPLATAIPKETEATEEEILIL
jgi:hypothetical protein